MEGRHGKARVDSGATRDVSSEPSHTASPTLDPPDDGNEEGDGGGGVPRQVIREGVKILFLAANSRGDRQLALGEELRAIQQALRDSTFRDAFEVVAAFAVRQNDLQRVLLQHRPDVVHFACHGSQDAELVLLQEDGTSSPVTTRTLTSYFRVLRNDIALVVMNACFSSRQATTVRRTIGMTIGMHQCVADDAAIRFSAAFYHALGCGCSVREAFDLGITAMASNPREHAGLPELFEREGIDTRAICLVGAQPPEPLPLLSSPGRGWPAYLVLVAVAAGLGIAAWRWFPAGAARGAGAAPADATVTDARSLDGPATVAAPSGMVLFTGARIRPGVFDLARRPAECAALTAAEDCAVRREPADIPEIALEDFYLDRYEVTNRDFVVWLDDHRDAWQRNALDPEVVETRTRPAVFLLRTGELCGLGFAEDRIGPRKGRADQPANCMTWMAARDYCLAHPDHKRLPLDAEWEFAAKGVEGRAFPWGDQRPHPDRVAFRRGGSTAAHPVEGGASAQDVSPQGVHDLGGNVAEWVDDMSSLDEHRTIRGGSWHSDDLCHLLSSGCKHIKAESFSRDVGFRCAKTAVIDRKGR